MALDYRTLMEVNPDGFGELGFHQAEPFAVNGAESFQHTENVVTGGVAWTGEGQPEASAVVRTNAVGLQAARLQMRAGVTAMDALATAIRSAQQQARSVLDEIAAVARDAGGSVSVSAEGVVSFVGVDDTSADLVENNLLIANLKMQSILIYARSADLAATQLLNRIAAAVPVFTAHASVRVLAYNTAVHAIASSNLVLSKTALSTWQEQGPLDWRPVDESTHDFVKAFKETFVPDPEEYAAEKLREQTSNRLQERLPVEVQQALKGAEDGLKKASWVVTGYQFFDSARVTPHLVDDRGPTTPYGMRPIQDPDLAALSDRYFLHDRGQNLTVTQAARLDAVGALSGDGGRDYVAEARMLEDDLRSEVASFLQDEAVQEEYVPDVLNGLDGFDAGGGGWTPPVLVGYDGIGLDDSPYSGPNALNAKLDVDHRLDLIDKLEHAVPAR